MPDSTRPRKSTIGAVHAPPNRIAKQGIKAITGVVKAPCDDFADIWPESEHDTIDRRDSWTTGNMYNIPRFTHLLPDIILCL